MHKLISAYDQAPRWPLVLGFIALLGASLCLSLVAGAASLTLAQWTAFFNGVASTHVNWVINEVRLPRALLASMVGAHFALAGFILQTVTRNALADAGILGISAGASLAAVGAILSATMLDLQMFSSSTIVSALPYIAMLGGVAVALGIYRLSGATRMTPLRLIVTGVVLSSVLNACVTGALALWGHSQTEMIMEWLAGSLHGRNWSHVYSLWPWTLFGLAGCVLLRRPLAVLRLDDDLALGLGLRVSLWRFAALALAAMLAASAVGVVGPVGFVGLLVPHICRRLCVANFGLQFVCCVGVGALLMMLADVLGRVIILPYELPVGVVCALIGVPFFLYLLRRQV
ncbi:iron ABC transporter permease [Neptunomonas sp. XY-337]|uniref:FecCD family ABC transporter permease n=1 Tax=Neptunomonas sp. XY-337 TaxID=2561897 RepID=UPI0010AA91DA|nr:iron ABC transporter permease [Neptunomonas sp. XY-337]